MHLKGEYPDWWMGRRWDRPIEAWAAGETSLACRDIVQKMLCGKPGIVAEQGSGMIPRAAVNWVKDVTSARGISNFYDTIHVKHISGGFSSLYFKTYEQGATKWQGASLDLIWFDEEPPEDVYAEGLARLGDRGGMAFMTFTPLEGKSKVVCRFTDIPDPFRATVTMTIDDALHMKPEERQALISSYLPHQMEARLRGVPTQGAGVVFPIGESSIKEPAVQPMPAHWFYVWGIDFGILHPFAAVLIGWDKDTDIIHVVHGIRMLDAMPISHAYAMKQIAPTAPVAWPQDGTARESSGETVATQYKKQGLKMLPEHATHPEGGLGTEAG